MQQQTPKVVVRRSARRKRTVTAYRERDTIVVLLPAHLSATDEAEFVSDLVAKVLRREARAAAPTGDEELTRRAATLVHSWLAPVVERPVLPSRVTWVTNQHRRWGSCTPATGTIRLSARLRTAPDWVVDYVLLHELVHLEEPSHSARFWRLVDRYPQAERAKGYLEGYTAGTGAPPDADDVPGADGLPDDRGA